MGLMDSLKKACKTKGQEMVREALEGKDGSRAPDDAEAYAEKVAEAISADVRMFSGCMDSQTSADVHDVSKFGLPNADGAGGACTNAMLLNLSDDQQDSWLSLLKGMQSTLKGKKFSQIPQLSTSRQIDVMDNFTLVNEKSNGNMRSLLIGINYIGQQGELAGCHNDVSMMTNFITTHGYDTDPEHCLILMDDGSHTDPTHKNIMNGLRWLVSGASAGDSLFMHYSGHGGSVRDTNGDEADNMDETIVPMDYTSAGQITDDVILKELVMVLPEGVTLTVVMDCCHSGSILDLPYTIKADSGTIHAVEEGDAPSAMPMNPGFDFAKMLKIGKELYAIFSKGGGLDSASMGRIAKLAMS